MKIYIKIAILIISSFTIFYGCGPRFLGNEWVSFRIMVDSDPPGAGVYDNYGVRLGTTPYVYERQFAKQLWTDETAYFDEKKRTYIPGKKKEDFEAILMKEGFKAQSIKISYTFNGEPEILRRWYLLNR